MDREARRQPPSRQRVGLFSDKVLSYRSLREALALLRIAHDCLRRTAEADPGNAGWQRDLMVSYWRLAVMAEQSGTGEAQAWWRKAYETLSAMKQRGIMLPTDEQYLAQLRGKCGA